MPARWVGAANYRALVSPEFWEVVTNTVKYSVGVVVLSQALGLALAVLLNDRTRLGALLQASIFSSYVVSWVAVSLLWIWLLDPQYGLVAYLFRLVGLRGVNWLGDHRLALWTLVLVTVWKTVGYPMVIYLAGLQAIPGDLYEAAALDGAGGWQRFRHITWPLLTPTTLFLLVTLTITSFQGFDIVKIMTQGGPVTSTVIYVYYIYEQAFQYFKLGKASAAVVLFFVGDRGAHLRPVAGLPPPRPLHDVSARRVLDPRPHARRARPRGASSRSSRTSGWSAPRSRTWRA